MPKGAYEIVLDYDDKLIIKAGSAATVVSRAFIDFLGSDRDFVTVGVDTSAIEDGWCVVM